MGHVTMGGYSSVIFSRHCGAFLSGQCRTHRREPSE